MTLWGRSVMHTETHTRPLSDKIKCSVGVSSPSVKQKSVLHLETESLKAPVCTYTHRRALWCADNLNLWSLVCVTCCLNTVCVCKPSLLLHWLVTFMCECVFSTWFCCLCLSCSWSLSCVRRRSAFCSSLHSCWTSSTRCCSHTHIYR